MEPARTFHVVVQRFTDGYVAHARGVDAAILGEGDSFDEAVADVRSAIRESIETFGQGIVDEAQPLEVANVSVNLQ